MDVQIPKNLTWLVSGRPWIQLLLFKPSFSRRTAWLQIISLHCSNQIFCCLLNCLTLGTTHKSFFPKHMGQLKIFRIKTEPTFLNELKNIVGFPSLRWRSLHTNPHTFSLFPLCSEGRRFSSGDLLPLTIHLLRGGFREFSQSHSREKSREWERVIILYVL